MELCLTTRRRTVASDRPGILSIDRRRRSRRSKSYGSMNEWMDGRMHTCPSRLRPAIICSFEQYFPEILSTRIEVSSPPHPPLAGPNLRSSIFDVPKLVLIYHDTSDNNDDNVDPGLSFTTTMETACDRRSWNGQWLVREFLWSVFDH